MDNSHKMKKIQMNLIKGKNLDHFEIGIISFLLKVLIIICVINPRKNSSSIHIIINQKGNHRVFSESPCGENNFIEPDEIYINGIQKEVIANNYDLNSSENNITLIWEKDINSTACLFKACHNITQVDLSDFHSTEIIFINEMFWHCTLLF